MTKFKELTKDYSLHFSLKEYIVNYILNNEKIITDLNINNNSYFFTNKRVITFQGEFSPIKSNGIKSYFYDKISSIKYNNHLVNLDKYGLLEFNFLDSDKKLILDFPENIIFHISNIIEQEY